MHGLLSRRGCLMFLGVALGVLAAAPCVRADALAAVQVLREGGCGGLVPAARPLRRSALLDRAAEQWATGSTLPVATQRSGYRAQAAAGVHVSGADGSMLELMRRSECREVTNRALEEIGIYHRGSDSWLVLAAGSAAPIGARAAPSVSAPLNVTVSPNVPASGSARPPLPHAPGPMLASRALELVNDVRARGARCGKREFAPAPPVSLSGTLGGVALGHASDMAAHNYFEHEDLAGQSPADRVRAVGYREKLVGENIAYGPQTVEEVVQGWLDSPGHCENIMDPRFAEMGIAFAAGRVQRRGLYWVQLLAAPRA